MVSTLHTTARAMLMAGLVGGFALVAPPGARAQAITPERALLNRVPRIAFAHRNAAPTGVAHGWAGSLIDGERALLNHSQATAEAPVDAIVTAGAGVDGPYPTGVKALLNRPGS